ncbi:hypothetical protein EVAR_75686_1 [Eumeta japonica]|uniref:Uncharacterized protein n=1 Tax=Eumeta variegata TaxID=151549 RepID=A0A4C1W0K3_EUMVA|nr:hypothetical protein EVAR_75686_1 [Eumeta japonica]
MVKDWFWLLYAAGEQCPLFLRPNVQCTSTRFPNVSPSSTDRTDHKTDSTYRSSKKKNDIIKSIMSIPNTGGRAGGPAGAPAPGAFPPTLDVGQQQWFIAFRPQQRSASNYITLPATVRRSGG